MSVINTNVKALTAQNAMAVNGRNLSKAMEQLSTGKRINGAADDAAGLAISSKMTSQVRGLDQAVRNANDSISLLQTAEGAMIEVTNMLQRMREVSVQSANDTNTAEDRSYLDLEFQQLKGEIDRVINNTQWNGVNVLDTSFTNNTDAGKFTFQVGANADQTIDHTISVFELGAAAATVTDAAASGGVDADLGTAQVQVLELSDDYVEGDVITINLNENMFRFTVSATDTGDSALIATSLEAALEAKFSDDFDFTVGTGAVTFAIDADAVSSTSTSANEFTLSATVSDGTWDDIVDLEIDTQTNSNSAITTLDVALTSVNKARAELGSVINRLTYAADNLSNVSQNTSASRSRVMDTDYAKATTDLAKSQIIQQAATAMLAQANQQPSAVLSLLQ
jgi:flagellin